MAKVQKYEEEYKPVTYQPYVCHRCHKVYRECNCDDDKWTGTVNSYSHGLEHDTTLYELLVQGEKAGLISLIYDDDQITIIGYINMSTQVVYELTSYEDYSNGY